MNELSELQRRPPEIIEAAEVAKMLSVPTSYVYQLARERKIPAIRLGRYVRFDRLSILAWLPTLELDTA